MGTTLGRRAHTTIDRSKPNAAIALAGGAELTTSAQVGLKTDFADDVAGPFPANLLCFQYGGGPANVCDSAGGFIYGYNANCSVPTSGGKATTTTLKVTLAGKAKASGARRSTSRAPVVHGGPTLLPDGRFHGERPARRFAADALSG